MPSVPAQPTFPARASRSAWPHWGPRHSPLGLKIGPCSANTIFWCYRDCRWGRDRPRPVPCDDTTWAPLERRPRDVDRGQPAGMNVGANVPTSLTMTGVSVGLLIALPYALATPPIASEGDSSSICASTQDFCDEEWIRKRCSKTCATVRSRSRDTGDLPVEIKYRTRSDKQPTVIDRTSLSDGAVTDSAASEDGPDVGEEHEQESTVTRSFCNLSRGVDFWELRNRNAAHWMIPGIPVWPNELPLVQIWEPFDGQVFNAEAAGAGIFVRGESSACASPIAFELKYEGGADAPEYKVDVSQARSFSFRLAASSTGNYTLCWTSPCMQRTGQNGNWTEPRICSNFKVAESWHPYDALRGPWGHAATQHFFPCVSWPQRTLQCHNATTGTLVAQFSPRSLTMELGGLS